MHEVGLARAILDTVLAKAGGRRVLGAGVRVGSSHRVFDDAMRQGFLHVSEGTVAEGADLEVEIVPARLACQSCGARVDVADPMVACPSCHSIDVVTESQDELTLTWVRYES